HYVDKTRIGVTFEPRHRQSDRRERILELVCHPARRLPKRFQPARLTIARAPPRDPRPSRASVVATTRTPERRAAADRLVTARPARCDPPTPRSRRVVGSPAGSNDPQRATPAARPTAIRAAQ